MIPAPIVPSIQDMYSWGDDTSDWAKPGAYRWDGGTAEDRAKAAKEARARGPRTYEAAGGPNENIVTPKKRISSASKNPLIIAVDVTGSMQTWPREIFDRLPLLYQTLSQYRPDLEICFAAIGDAYADRWPLQVTEFGKGYGLEERLKAIYGEGGGGDAPESYGLFAYYVQHKASVPNADRPFCIVFGDAPMHPKISSGELRSILDEESQGGDAIASFRAVSRTWNTWFLRRPGGHKGDEVDKQWSQAIGAQQVVQMEDEQRAVDWAMGLVARSWGHFEDFKENMHARQDADKVRTIEDRVAAIERVIEAAKAPRVLDCPRCGAPLPKSDAREIECPYCAANVALPLRA